MNDAIKKSGSCNSIRLSSVYFNIIYHPSVPQLLHSLNPLFFFYHERVTLKATNITVYCNFEKYLM